MPGSEMPQILSWEAGRRGNSVYTGILFRGNIAKRDWSFHEWGSQPFCFGIEVGNMWLAKNTAGKRKESTEYSGNTPVSSICARSGEHFAVGACEYRRLPHCAPYGIYTRPAQGEDLMILSAQSGGGLPWVVSQQQEMLCPEKFC